MEAVRRGIWEPEPEQKRTGSGLSRSRSSRSASSAGRRPGSRAATLEDYRDMTTHLLSMVPTVAEALIALHRPQRGRGTVLFRHVLERLPASLFHGGAEGVTIFVPVDGAFVGAGLASWRPECLDVHVVPAALSMTDLQGAGALNTQGMLRPSSSMSRASSRGSVRPSSRAGDRYEEEAMGQADTRTRAEIDEQSRRRREDTDSGARTVGLLGKDRLRVQTDEKGKVQLWVDGDSWPARKATILKTDIMCRGGTIIHLVDKILF